MADTFVTPRRPEGSAALRDIGNVASQPRPPADDLRKPRSTNLVRKLGMPQRIKPEERVVPSAPSLVNDENSIGVRPLDDLPPAPNPSAAPLASPLAKPLDAASSFPPRAAAPATTEPMSVPRPRPAAAAVSPEGILMAAHSSTAAAAAAPAASAPAASRSGASVSPISAGLPPAVTVTPAASVSPVSAVPANVPSLPVARPAPTPAPAPAPPQGPAAAPVAPPVAAPVPAATPTPPAAPVFGNGKCFVVNGVAYARLDSIGKGGSSKVYRVISESGKIFALKRVQLAGADQATVASYVNEIHLLTRLRGRDHIVTLFDSYIDRSHGYIYMVMECGEIDLAKMLQKRQGKPLDENFIRYFWQQMLLAVQTVHEERIVHSDLKPANFLLVEGTLKLIDFGIASAIQNDATSVVRENQVGTVNYMSPEALIDTAAAAGGPTAGNKQMQMKLGPASDVWSLGCILYQMVYGATPFAALPIIQKIQTIMDRNHTIAYPPISNQALLASIQGLLFGTFRCLRREPAKRLTIPALLEHPFLRPTSTMDGFAS